MAEYCARHLIVRVIVPPILSRQRSLSRTIVAREKKSAFDSGLVVELVIGKQKYVIYRIRECGL